MFPLIIVAFAGIGVTRLALLALELHESSEPEEAASQGGPVNRETAIEEMKRLEKPKKLVLKNDCQYVCIWKDEDLKDDVPIEEMLSSCASKRDASSDFAKAFQDMATFWERVFTGKDGAPKPMEHDDGPLPVPVEMPTDADVWSDRLSATGSTGDVFEVGSGGDYAEISQDHDDVKDTTAMVGSERGTPTKQDECHSADCPHDPNTETSSSRGTSPRNEDICLVCYDNRQDAVLLTCGHGSICFSCAIDVYRTTRECPLCRSKVDQVVTVGPKSRLRNGLEVVNVTGPS